MADIAGGQLVDAENRVSKQQDLVLVLRSAPRFRFSSNVEIIPIEAVLGAMEIKSTLKKKEVEFAVSNFESVKALTVSVVSFGQMGVTHTWPATRTLTLLVAYDSGGGLERVHQWLDEIGGDGLPDVVLVLSEGLLVKNHGLLFPKQQEPATYLRVAEPGQGLMWVLMFLTEIAGTVMSRGVQWRRYCT